MCKFCTCCIDEAPQSMPQPLRGPPASTTPKPQTQSLPNIMTTSVTSTSPESKSEPTSLRSQSLPHMSLSESDSNQAAGTASQSATLERPSEASQPQTCQISQKSDLTQIPNASKLTSSHSDSHICRESSYASDMNPANEASPGWVVMLQLQEAARDNNGQGDTVNKANMER